MSDNMAKAAPVIIVGAGLSGLCAAKLLKETGIDVIVLEANDRAGGRLYTKRSDDVGYVDVGGAYVGPTQNRVFRLASELGVTTYRVYEDNDTVYYRNGKSHRFRSFDLPMGSISAVLDVNNLYREMDRLLDTVPPDNPWEAPEAAILDRMSAQEWFDKNIWTDAAMREAQLFCKLNLASEAHALSLLWVLWYARQAGGTSRMNSTEGGAQERKFVGGSQQLCDKIAEKLQEEVTYNSPVAAIEQDNRGVCVQTADAHHYYGSHVILSMAPTLQGKIHFRPPLPPKRAQFLQRVPMGSVIKTICYYKEPYWRQRGFNGTMVCVDDDLSLPIGGTMDDCKPDGSYPAIMGFILAEKAVKLSCLSPEERADLVSKQYAKVFECPEMSTPIHYEELDWCSQPWSGGCYSGTMGPGVLTTFGPAIREPIGRVYLAGTETATEWTGYMEGAIQAGERAAREVLFDLGKVTREDIHVTEPPLPDYPAPVLSPSLWEAHAPSLSTLARLASVLGSLAVGGVLLAKL